MAGSITDNPCITASPDDPQNKIDSSKKQFKCVVKWGCSLKINSKFEVTVNICTAYLIFLCSVRCTWNDMMENKQEENNTKENLKCINISCEQIPFNPPEKNVAIIDCEQKYNKNYDEDIIISNILKPTKMSTISKSYEDIANARRDFCDTRHDVACIICLAVILILILVWISLLIFFKNKESEWTNRHNNTIMNNQFMDEEYSST